MKTDYNDYLIEIIVMRVVYDSYCGQSNNDYNCNYLNI